MTDKHRFVCSSCQFVVYEEDFERFHMEDGMRYKQCSRNCNFEEKGKPMTEEKTIYRIDDDLLSEVVFDDANKVLKLASKRMTERVVNFLKSDNIKFDHGYSFTNRILKSTDGGESWDHHLYITSETEFNLY